jgi:hypothetical protein
MDSLWQVHGNATMVGSYSVALSEPFVGVS